MGGRGGPSSRRTWEEKGEEDKVKPTDQPPLQVNHGGEGGDVEDVTQSPVTKDCDDDGHTGDLLHRWF